jgi:hypothetical protein
MFEPGTFLHTQDKRSRLRRETHPDAELVILITARGKNRDKHIYRFEAFHYYPGSPWRLSRVCSDKIQDSISSSVLEKEGWQVVDISKSEIANKEERPNR